MRAPTILIGTKFALTLVVLVPALVIVAFVGLGGMAQMHEEVDTLYDDNVQNVRLSTELGDNLDAAAKLSLLLIPTIETTRQAVLDAKLDETQEQVGRNIEALRKAYATDHPSGQRKLVEQIAAGWSEFLELRRTTSFDAVGFDRAFVLENQRLADRVSALFDRLSTLSARQLDVEVVEAAEAQARADAVYSRSRLRLLVILLAAIGAGVGSVLLLVRDVVPRMRSYSRFAARVSSGELTYQLHPRGRDEIAELGRSLDEMVAHRRAEREREAAQAEFVHLMQVAEDEDEAYDLLRRQLERSVAGGSAIVLNRNNSADRLEATRALPTDSDVRERLSRSTPRSCLAVRFGRTHREGPGRAALMCCDVCGNANGFSICQPLLVGGEVIGAALVQHPEPLVTQDQAAVLASVSQSAPVLANLRNLALAEFRAATDSLTGLPNSRAARDTLKRMVAQASRTVSPLAALLLDLDRFKQINDSFGHGSGDDVLAAVGSVIPSVLREADFVGRYGGEEFLILLPATGREDAFLVAEKVRGAIETITVAGVSQAITASLGIAVLPDDAGDATTLVRHADRALYAAKANGRNRVETAEQAPLAAAEG